MTIPINNLYYLLSYAWDHLDEAALIAVSPKPMDTPADLLARVLTSGVRHLLRFGLDRGYTTNEETLVGMRGKLDVGLTLKRCCLPNAKTICHVDELTLNVPHNQVIKATLSRLLLVHDLDAGLRSEACRLHHQLGAVDEPRDPHRSRVLVQLHRNNRFYDFMMHVCDLIISETMPTEGSGVVKFRDFTRDESAMRSLFEKFVFNFLLREQADYKVSRPKLHWARLEGTAQALRYLPEMRTDIVLTNRSSAVIIDTKFSQKVLQDHFGKKSLRSEHLYQLMAYLQHAAEAWPNLSKIRGVLLYPVVQEVIKVEFMSLGFPVTVQTLDLREDWRSIKEQILALAA